ncbi:nucleotidyltransferase domain-containing protein [Bacillus haimaensis]|uniref:nucleotidyltransferase domain-containing protein n=1 Tax=Bacillus haimaensis TaxID=3160967 RepID=UPI003AA893C6
MRESILAILSKLEDDYEVRILYACEAGSRSYGVENEKSDYDIRFIYIAPLRRYLSIIPVDDTISYKQGEWDIQGWDIQKALRLALKSNPSLYEWAHSPVFYMKDEELTDKLRTLAQKEFSKRTLVAHYTNMAKRNLRAFEEKGAPSSLYQGLRASLMAENLSMDGVAATILMTELIAESIHFSHHDLKNVLDLKNKATNQSFNGLLGKIRACIEQAQQQETRLPHTKPDINGIQELFFRKLGI